MIWRLPVKQSILFLISSLLLRRGAVYVALKYYPDGSILFTTLFHLLSICLPFVKLVYQRNLLSA